MHYNKFIAKENLVHEYLEHLQNMQRIKGKKEQEPNGKNPEQDRRHMMTMNGGNK
jgi:hypothetical protein